MPFDPDAYLQKRAMPKTSSGTFNPDAYLQKKAAPLSPAPESSWGQKGEAALQGAGNAMTFGYLPELQAAASGLLPESDVDQKLKAQGFNVQGPPQDYSSELSQMRQREGLLQEQDPLAYGAGTLAGTAVSAPLLGAGLKGAGLVGKATGALGRTAEAVGSGAAMGALSNPGETEDLGSNLQARAQQGLMGGALGGAFHGAGEALGKFASGSKRLALKSVGASERSLKQIQKLDPSGMEGHTADALADFAMKKGIVKPGQDIADVARSVGERKKATGEEIGQIYKTVLQNYHEAHTSGLLNPATQDLLQTVTPNKKALIGEIDSQIKTLFEGKPDGNKAIRAVQQQLGNLAKNKGETLDVGVLQGFKSELDDIVYGNDRELKISGKTKTAANDALKAMRNMLSDKVNQGVSAIQAISPDQNLSARLSELNQDYGKYSTLSKLARDKLAKETGNNYFSLTDKMAMFGMGGLGAYHEAKEGNVVGIAKGAALGIGAGYASKIGRRYGTPGMAKLGAALPKSYPTGLLGSAGGLLGKDLAKKTKGKENAQ